MEDSGNSGADRGNGEVVFSCGREDAATDIPPTDQQSPGPTRDDAVAREVEFHNEKVGGQDKRSPLTEFLQQDLKGLTMAEMSFFFHRCLELVLDNIDFPHCKSKNSGSIFPLPVTSSVLQHLLTHLTAHQVNLLVMMCRSLNSYYGVASEDRHPLSQATVSALRLLAGYAETVSFWVEKFEGVNWGDFLSVKSID